MSFYLSKSRYCSGVQCPKILWLKKNKPDVFDDSVMNQAVLETGSEVGDLAMGLFGEFIEVPFGDLSQMIRITEELIEKKTPVIVTDAQTRGVLRVRALSPAAAGRDGESARDRCQRLRQR